MKGIVILMRRVVIDRFKLEGVWRLGLGLGDGWWSWEFVCFKFGEVVWEVGYCGGDDMVDIFCCV